jgi:hypothetical protein
VSDDHWIASAVCSGIQDRAHERDGRSSDRAFPWLQITALGQIAKLCGHWAWLWISLKLSAFLPAATSTVLNFGHLRASEAGSFIPVCSLAIRLK